MTSTRSLIFPVLVSAGLLAALVLVFFVAPPEVKMGEVQRIFYFHVSSAFSALLLFIGCALGSLSYLILHRMAGFRALSVTIERIAAAMGEIGVLFGVIVLVTGPLWAKPAWGEYWTWEPRLMLMLLTVFLFIGYVVLRRVAGTDEAGRRLAAGVAVIGGPAVYLIHVAVEMWGGNHPQVVSGEGGGLEAGAMATTFGVSVGAVFLFAGYLVWTRYQAHALEAELEDCFLTLSDLEDSPT